MASDLFDKFACTYCQSDIVGLRVKCNECHDFELCLQCFSAGAEIGPHKNDHSYQFVDSGPMDVFRDRTGWTSQEEVLLLNAIERYGFGNWEDISQQIETRTPEEARDEYVSRFLDGSIGRMTWSQAANNRPVLNDMTVQDPGPLAPSTISRIPSLDFSPEEVSHFGFSTLSDELEMEFDNEAEVLVSSLEDSSIEDDELDTALKLAHVDMYTQKLRERARRKRVARDYQLILQFFCSRRDKPKKRISRDEKELEERLRPFCQFHTAAEHEQFVSGLLRLKELTRRHSELLQYRRNGLTKFEELPHYEQERFARHNSRSGSRSLISLLRHSHLVRKKEKEGEEGHASAQKGSKISLRNGDSASPSDPLPSQHLLSPTEAQMCSSMEMTPTQFVTMKTLMLSDPLQKTDTPTEKQVMDHLISNGWVT